ncbi:MAG: exodeoxyribonuclease VII large subunit [Coriobacteriia bacterium]|nr:exodeoxyribonuclease VII large subunit [Coriobacteriia bacterium]MCL2746656.1 exodeoxyribonuclease VII large subunit [Coriobacteriia bacterium]MCL2870953.1 exodeoxyribonuclease VII large subunit [Coriobacteriia bacterium]
MPSKPEQSAISVSEALNIVKIGLESMRMRIIGEVSGFTGNRYATKYLSLKDSDSALKCIIWGNVYKAAGVDLKDGLEVEVEGKFSVYPQKGEMSFHVSKIHIAGEGQLRLELARLEARLRAEGLFDEAHKQSPPLLPRKIAVVTSPAGAVIHDITKTLARRWPFAEVLLFGVRVEGSEAEERIVEGLQAADVSQADVVILARGGGSFEDLLPFSSERVVRVIAAMQKPVVAGIGHEPDISLADHVADLRAPTPTAAAEVVSTPNVDDIQQILMGSSRSMSVALQKKVRLLRQQLDSYSSRPVFSGPEALLQVRAMMLDSVLQRMTAQMGRGFEAQSAKLLRAQEHLHKRGNTLVEQRRHRLEQNAQALDALSPLKVLGRGYAAVFDEESGEVLDTVEAANIGQDIRIRLKDGQLDCEVKGVRHG